MTPAEKAKCAESCKKEGKTCCTSATKSEKVEKKK
jgi:hypothetical protein